MKRLTGVACLISWLILFAGCQSTFPTRTAGNLAKQPERSEGIFDAVTRARVQRAAMTVEVSDPRKCASEAETMTRKAGGFIDHSTVSEEESVDLTLRVPQEECDRLLDAFGQFGKMKRRQMQSEDVTEQIVDVQARLDNLRSTRDRLRLQLDNAVDVTDTLAVEKELTRVQSELESLEARLKVIQDDVAFTEVSLTLERRVIYGPVTYIGKAVWWGIEKLFVIH